MPRGHRCWITAGNHFNERSNISSQTRRISLAPRKLGTIGLGAKYQKSVGEAASAPMTEENAYERLPALRRDSCGAQSLTNLLNSFRYPTGILSPKNLLLAMIPEPSVGIEYRAENQSRLRQQCFNRHQNLKVSLTQCYQLIQQGIGIGRFSVHVSHEQIIATHGQRNQIALISELLEFAFGGQQKERSWVVAPSIAWLEYLISGNFAFRSRPANSAKRAPSFSKRSDAAPISSLVRGSLPEPRPGRGSNQCSSNHRELNMCQTRYCFRIACELAEPNGDHSTRPIASDASCNFNM